QKEQAEVHATEQRLNNLRSEGEKYRDLESERTMTQREIEAVLKTTKDRFLLFQAERKNRDFDLTSVVSRKEAAAARLDEIGGELDAISRQIEELTQFKQQNESARDLVLAKLSDQKSQ